MRKSWVLWLLLISLLAATGCSARKGQSPNPRGPGAPQDSSPPFAPGTQASETLELPETASRLIFSPSGEYAVIYQPALGLVGSILERKTLALKRLPGLANHGRADWSEASSRLVCYTYPDNPELGGEAGLVVATPENDQWEMIYSVDLSEQRFPGDPFPAWGPDEQAIRFMEPRGIMEISGPGGQPRLLVPARRLKGLFEEDGGLDSFRWNPPASMAAWIRQDSVRPEIWVVDVASGEARALGEFDEIQGGLAWDPRSEAIYIAAGGPTSAIWRLELRTGEKKQITQGPSHAWPAVSPSGERIAFLADGGQSMGYMDQSGTVQFFSGSFAYGEPPIWLSETEVAAQTSDNQLLIFRVKE